MIDTEIEQHTELEGIWAGRYLCNKLFAGILTRTIFAHSTMLFSTPASSFPRLRQITLAPSLLCKSVACFSEMNRARNISKHE